jgi:protein-S-isoprenylcysteine O-methyltransferase Ste14
MTEKLSKMGSGSKIGRIVFLYFAVVAFLDYKFPKIFGLPELPYGLWTVAGIIFVIAGVLFYGWSVRYLLKGLKTTTLITNGPFALTQNPLYASFFVFLLPGIACFMRSWLVLTSMIVFYFAFRKYIKAEYVEMEKFFGDDYRRYRAETSELIPWCKKKESVK